MISRISIDAPSGGAPLATSVWAELSEPLHCAGAVLSDHQRLDLAERGFRSVLVSLGPSRAEMELVRPRARAQLWAPLMRAFEFLDDEQAVSVAHPAAVIERTAELANACDALIADLQDRSRLPSPSPTPLDPITRRTHDAINGAAVAVYVGLQIGLPSAALRDLAHGMLLRDIAQSPEALTAGPLLPGDRVSVERHAEKAFEMLHGLGWGNAAVRLVVGGHHERQDGSGYPGNLKGLNSVRRILGQRFNRELMHPLAELAGVADVFTALNADRPHRLAFSPRAVAGELLQHGERSLSQEAARALLQRWDAPHEAPSRRDDPLHLGRSVSATGLGPAAGR